MSFISKMITRLHSHVAWRGHVTATWNTNIWNAYYCIILSILLFTVSHIIKKSSKWHTVYTAYCSLNSKLHSESRSDFSVCHCPVGGSRLMFVLSCVAATPIHHHGHSCLRLRVFVCCSTGEHHHHTHTHTQKQNST